MDDKLHSQLRDALKIVAMKPDSSRAMLNSRIRRLKSDSLEKGDQERFKAIEAAEVLLFEHLDVLHLVQEDEETVREDKLALFRKSEKDKKSIISLRRINYKLVAMILTPIIVVLIVIGSIISSRNALEQQYAELETMMRNFNRFNYEAIAEVLDELPTDYRNVAQYQKEYDYIMQYVYVIESGNIQADYEAMRIAYAELKVLDAELNRWDFHRYFARYDHQIFLYGIIWTNDWYYLQVSHGPRDGQIFEELRTNLPSQRQEHIDYVFTHDRNYIYLNFEGVNEPDTVRGYRIVSISQYELTIYVYSLGDLVTLRRGYFRLDANQESPDENISILGS